MTVINHYFLFYSLSERGAQEGLNNRRFRTFKVLIFNGPINHNAKKGKV